MCITITDILMIWFQTCRKKPQKKEPTSFFEHFVVVGLRPHSDVQAIETAFARKKIWQRDAEKASLDSFNPNAPTLEPEVVQTATCYKHASLRFPEFVRSSFSAD